MAEDITNATEMAGLNKKKRCFDVSFKLKVLKEAKIPHEMVRKKRGGGGGGESRGNSAHAGFKSAIPN